ncbi:hypothetical protein [Helicobacter sp. MIT 01-3238]|uniref:hypothetical protein n=1 Tax=Helicobacter sp. MIT 01-3238 TaxID=398627 RepID=UPI000E1F282E|nr:hypothetical protein [Helicobacter sp. MIT 01-3238]RDU54551.1 hypothetical protein CQA40_03270 [Helicobacter sp. MIT 01-3238]
MNDFIKKIKKSINPSLMAESSNGYFVVYEKDKNSSIKWIKCVFKNIDNVLILQQRNQIIPQRVLKDYSTSKSCDFIVLFSLENQLNIAYCEIKTSYTDRIADESLQQIECSRLFMGYLFDCYSYFYENNLNRESIVFKRYLIYDKKGISNKNGSYIKNDKVLYLRGQDVGKDGGVVIDDASLFFSISYR